MKWPSAVLSGRTHWVCVWCDVWNGEPTEDAVIACEGCGKMNAIELHEGETTGHVEAHPYATLADQKYCAAMGREIPAHVRRENHPEQEHPR